MQTANQQTDLYTMSKIIASTALRTCDKGAGKIHDLRVSLRRDFAILDAGAYASELEYTLHQVQQEMDDFRYDYPEWETHIVYGMYERHESNLKQRYASAYQASMRGLSDAYDLVTCACDALIAHGYDETSEDNANAVKSAYKAVNASIYSHKSVQATKTVYLDTLQRGENGEITDESYVRVTRHYDIDNIADYDTTQDALDAIYPLLSAIQRDTVHKRMQGKSVSQIAAEKGVSQAAISKHLAKARKAIREALPDMIRGYDE